MTDHQSRGGSGKPHCLQGRPWSEMIWLIQVTHACVSNLKKYQINYKIKSSCMYYEFGYLCVLKNKMS